MADFIAIRTKSRKLSLRRRYRRSNRGGLSGGEVLRCGAYVILMFVVNVLVAGARRVQRCPCDFVAQGRARQRKTTVDQTLMRGLVTAGPVFVLGLPLSQGRGSVPPNHTEGCPDLPPRPPLCNEGSILACLSRLRACPGETSLMQA